MNLDDLKDRLASDLRQTSERLQESAIFNQLRDRYENMSPSMQKLTVVGASALIAFVILSFPYGNFSTSTENVSEFESKRMTIRELLKVSREASEVPEIPAAPPVSSLRATIENQIKSANLLPEQIKGTQELHGDSGVIPKSLAEGVLQVNLAKLNLRQVLDLGYQFQSISTSVKLKDMSINANREDGRYFDVVYKLVTLAVPAAPEPPPPEPPSKNKKRNSESEE
jgi:hypothetical protein